MIPTAAPAVRHPRGLAPDATPPLPATGSGAQHAHERFSAYVATLGRGPGRSRALTRDEARDAFGMVLQGLPDPHQVGAMLMLLRYRGEDPDEISGLVEAVRAHEGLGRDATTPAVALDWPSYGAGRTRGAPWFLLSALALGQAGFPVLMHGTNEFTAGLEVGPALLALGLRPAASRGEAWAGLERDGFAYLPAEVLSPGLARLLGLRRLFGLRSPVNTVARLLDPADADASVDGVFHPPYIDVHLGVAERLRRPRLLVLKGGGGEAERPAAKPTTVHLWRDGAGRSEMVLPALGPAGSRSADTASLLDATWRGKASPDDAVALVVGTIGMALLALGRADTPGQADTLALDVWHARRASSTPGNAEPVAVAVPGE